jgi:hypothetical protein
MTAFNKFLESIQQARVELGLRAHQECFFRGNPDTAYALMPSLFRQGTRSQEEYWKLERRLFFEFRTRARQLYDIEHTGWDVLFHIQHHGVPTRLLDWTSVFGVALYFALLNYRTDAQQPACIWVMNPYALNHAAWGLHRLFNPRYLAREEASNRSYDYSELLLDTHPPHWGERRLWETPLAIYSHQRSERMFAQSGWFTIHGTDMRSIDEIFEERPGILKKIDLPQDAVPAARQFLELAGIGHRQLFPDLDGIARSLCAKFELASQRLSP